MTHITFVTGNKGKWAIARDIFQSCGVELLQEKIETPEIQSMDVTDVARFSADYAMQKLGKAVIKSDVGYYFSALNGFPGPFIKFINQTLSAECLLRLMHGQHDRTILLKECLAFAAPDGTTHHLVSEQYATLAHKAEGEGSSIDRLLILDGFTKPKSMYPAEEIFEHWKKSLGLYRDMALHIKSHTKTV